MEKKKEGGGGKKINVKVVGGNWTRQRAVSDLYQARAA